MEGGEGDGLCARCSGGSVMEHGRCVLAHVCLFICVLGRKEDVQRNGGEKKERQTSYFSVGGCFFAEVPKKMKQYLLCLYVMLPNKM